MSITPTILSKSLQIQPVPKMAIAFLSLDNAIPGGGYTLTPVMFGLTRFAVCDDGVTLVDPIPLSISSINPVMVWVDLGKLHVAYPTGGAAAAPAAPANPAGGNIAGITATATPAVGATPVTSTGAQPAIPVTFNFAGSSAPLTPGVGKELPAGGNCSTIGVTCMAFGY